MFKELVKQIDFVGESQLPLRLDEELLCWANLHGWNAVEDQGQRLLVRQALLNTIIQQLVPDVIPHAFATPLDTLDLEVPRALTQAVYDTMQRSYTMFNFWGDLYCALIPQSQRRRIGQFWTNEQITDWMISWLLQFKPRHLFDVGCGAGNFLLRARQQQDGNNRTKLSGLDISPLLLNTTLATFLTQPKNNNLEALPYLLAQDYFDVALPDDIDAIICNPPYTRHHHIAPELKDQLQTFFKMKFHLNVSRQATLAFFFLLKVIADMSDGAYAAVIVPMEVLDARYGKVAKQILCHYTSLTAIIHFAPQMNAFRNVDVGACILLFRKGQEKQNKVHHVTLNTLPETEQLLDCMKRQTPATQDLSFGSLVTKLQDNLLETSKWFSIGITESNRDQWQKSGLVVPLKSLAKVMRGIATGANAFFGLSQKDVEQFELEPYVVRTVHRNREIQEIILDEAHWQGLADDGKRVWLLYLNNEVINRDTSLGIYLTKGEMKGYHQRSLVKTRKKWYAMEQRDIPPIFFTLLTRGNPRFILNHAEARPLNMFHLIYPNQYVMRAGAIELLWALLNCRFSISRLGSISRTYGGSTLKVEPRELDNLPVINPLALTEEIKRMILGWINNFYYHRETAVLMRQIDELVENLLASETGQRTQSALPIQLRLLESIENNEDLFET